MGKTTTPGLTIFDKEKDKESDLNDFGARKYEDVNGRFTSIDPLWEKYLNFTLYQYSFNNPISFKDDNGKEVSYYVEPVSKESLWKGAPLSPIVGDLIYYTFGLYHSFVQVETPEYNVLLELGGPPKGSKVGTPIMTFLKKGQKPHREGQIEIYVFESQNQKSPFEFENKVYTQFIDVQYRMNYYKKPEYDEWGPNSNGFAKYLIESSGGLIPYMFGPLTPIVGIDNTAPYYPPEDKNKTEKKEKKQ